MNSSIQGGHFRTILTGAVILSCLGLVASDCLATPAAVCTFSKNPYAPGDTITVTIEVTAEPIVDVWALEDQMQQPAGTPLSWPVSNISHGGQWDGSNEKAKFGPFFDNLSRTLTFDITAPLDAEGSVYFVGQLSYNGINVPIAGERTLTPEPTALSLIVLGSLSLIRNRRR